MLIGYEGWPIRGGHRIQEFGKVLSLDCAERRPFCVTLVCCPCSGRIHLLELEDRFLSQGVSNRWSVDRAGVGFTRVVCRETLHVGQRQIACDSKGFFVYPNNMR